MVSMFVCVCPIYLISRWHIGVPQLCDVIQPVLCWSVRDIPTYPELSTVGIVRPFYEAGNSLDCGQAMALLTG